MDIKPNDRIKNNDPRMLNRVLTIRRVEDLRVVAQDSIGRTHSIQRQRVHVEDGKTRKSGFTLIGSAS